jgi:Rrf2 family protein
MKISKKLEYAFRALAQIAPYYGTRRLQHIDEIARNEDVPINYLVQILNKLSTSGIIRSKRGKAGGYKLGKAPDEISFYDVAIVVDPNMLTAKIRFQGSTGPRLSEVWKNVSKRTTDVLKETFLSDILPSDTTLDWAI